MAQESNSSEDSKEEKTEQNGLSEEVREDLEDPEFEDPFDLGIATEDPDERQERSIQTHDNDNQERQPDVVPEDPAAGIAPIPDELKQKHSVGFSVSADEELRDYLNELNAEGRKAADEYFRDMAARLTSMKEALTEAGIPEDLHPWQNGDYKASMVNQVSTLVSAYILTGRFVRPDQPDPRTLSRKNKPGDEEEDMRSPILSPLVPRSAFYGMDQ